MVTLPGRRGNPPVSYRPSPSLTLGRGQHPHRPLLFMKQQVVSRGQVVRASHSTLAGTRPPREGWGSARGRAGVFCTQGLLLEPGPSPAWGGAGGSRFSIVTGGMGQQ